MLIYIRNFIVTCFLFLLSLLPASAGAIKVQTFGSPINLINKISQPVNISILNSSTWKILIQALEPSILNQNNPNYSIPLTRLELAELGGNPISAFSNGKVIELASSAMNNINNLNLAFNLLTFENDRPGIYDIDVRFSLVDENRQVTEDVCCLRFIKEEISKIEFSKKIVNLEIDKDKSLQKNFVQNLPTPLCLYVSSNKNWKLYVRKIPDNNPEKINVSFRVVGADKAVNYNRAEYVELADNNLVLVASGKATFNDVANILDKKIINIDYIVKGPENQIMKAGSRLKEFEYRLETED